MQQSARSLASAVRAFAPRLTTTRPASELRCLATKAPIDNAPTVLKNKDLIALIVADIDVEAGDVEIVLNSFMKVVTQQVAQDAQVTLKGARRLTEGLLLVVVSCWERSAT